jgi:hypothetical protein
MNDDARYWSYIVLDVIFTFAAIILALQSNWTNSLVCFAVSELFSIQRKMMKPQWQLRISEGQTLEVEK